MADLRKVEAPDESLLVRFRWFTDPITPWVPQEISQKGLTDLIAVQRELQKSIYQAKIDAVDKLLARSRSRE
jgi:hypothetical protein